MCGIAGYVSLDSHFIRSTDRILKMLQLQKHRGPDDSGIRLFNLVNGTSFEPVSRDPVVVTEDFEAVIGFNRLSIQDLSENGHQPMISPDGKVIIALNGEIYNAFDFREELKGWGYNFKSTTDTEIVLAMYLKFGLEGMINRLNGMFAIVLADLSDRTVYIIRDRFGIKPIYYILTETIFAFASELKALPHAGNFRFTLDKEQLDEYLIFRNNLNNTLLKGVRSLQPGSYLSFNLKEGLREKSYFTVNSYTRTKDSSPDLGSFVGHFEEWLTDCVRRQLASDVTIGCQLSGGIDSSLVTLLANRVGTNGKLDSISVVFGDKRFSEERYIDQVTRQVGIVSHKFLLDAEYYYEHLEKATWHLETPLNHQNTIGIYFLSQRAKEFVTVLLSGEGADEITGGYERFGELRNPYRLRLLLHHLKRSGKKLTFLKNYSNHSFRAITASAFLAPDLALSLKADFDYGEALKSRQAVYNSLTGSWFDRQIKYEMLTYLPDLLIRQDKMSMAHAVENRVPFLDNEIVENSFRVPEEFLLTRRTPEGDNIHKYLLKKVAANSFGKEFAFREKMGFGIPLKEFMTDKRFTHYLKEKVIPGVRVRGIFNHKLISGWVENLPTIKNVELDALWVVTAFEIWASIYLDGNENSYSSH